MKQSSKRFASLLLCLAFLVAALLIFFELIEPAYGDLQTKKATQLSNQNFLATESQAVAQAKSLLTQYENDTVAESSLALAMPSGPDVAGALAELYGIAANNNINVQSIAISAPIIQQSQAAGSTTGSSLTLAQIVKPLGKLSLTLAASGNYENFKNFLSQLETNIRLFDITSLSLTPAVTAATTGKGGGNADLFSYSATVVTYYQLP